MQQLRSFDRQGRRRRRAAARRQSAGRTHHRGKPDRQGAGRTRAHFEGPRRHAPFVEINCASIPAQLLESELFRSRARSFTDAKTRKLGLVESANGGTLFLDEIGDMEPALQVKLLRLLENRTVRRVGGLRDEGVNVRIIAATHRHLEALVAEGRFRADLYFRIRMIHLSIPGAARTRGRHFAARGSLPGVARTPLWQGGPHAVRRCPTRAAAASLARQRA
jgi:transcriptional regulator of acetoin/glycerol metabolism